MLRATQSVDLSDDRCWGPDGWISDYGRHLFWSKARELYAAGTLEHSIGRSGKCYAGCTACIFDMIDGQRSNAAVLDDWKEESEFTP